MKKFFFCFTFFLCTALTPFAFAQESPPWMKQFQKILTVPTQSIQIPTVLELSWDDRLELSPDEEVIVWEETSKKAYPAKWIRENTLTWDITPNASVENPDYLLDKNQQTFTDILINKDGIGEAELIFTASEEVKLSGIEIRRAEHSALPSGLAFSVVDQDQQERLLTQNEKLETDIIRFPAVNGKIWKLKLKYTQMIRIQDIHFLFEDEQQEDIRLRFFAQPGASYRIFFAPDAPTNIFQYETGNLLTPHALQPLKNIPIVANPMYLPSDNDSDGIINAKDNCIDAKNTDQKDVNQNGRGDICEDFDGDGLLAYQDNCPEHPNNSQTDTDGDKIGDICDAGESRFTEQHPNIVWFALCGVFFAIVGMFLFVWKRHSNDLYQDPNKDL